MGKKKRAQPYTPGSIESFQKAIRDISYCHRPYENFRHFIEAVFCALAKRTAPTKERADELENRYMKVVAYYERTPEAMWRIAEILGQLALDLPDYDGDFLGHAYMTAEFGNKHIGQSFTPHCISFLQSQLIIDKETIEKLLAEGRVLPISDPASGSGGQVIAAAQIIRDMGFDPSQVMLATLVDVDQLVIQMAFVQLSLKGIPAICINGNTLSLETYWVAYTQAAVNQLIARQEKENTKPATKVIEEIVTREVESGQAVNARSGGPGESGGEGCPGAGDRQHQQGGTEASPGRVESEGDRDPSPPQHQDPDAGHPARAGEHSDAGAAVL